jgi:hypothetical protein
MSGVAIANETPKPVSMRDKKEKWHAASTQRDRVGVKGGYNTKAEVAAALEYQVDGATHAYVELDKNAQWFLKGVGGPKARKGDLKAVKVLDLLRKVISVQHGLGDADEGHAAVAAGSDPSAVADTEDDTQEADVDTDPMDAKDDVEEVEATMSQLLPQKKVPKPKPPRAQEEGRALALAVEVPTSPPCVPRGTTVRQTTIHLYRRAAGDKRSNGRLYLRTDHLDWLFAYAADELAFQGVQASPADPTPQPGNCSAVAGLRLEWDFSAKAWEGAFVTGPLAGTTRRMAVHDLNQRIWDKLKEESLVEGPLILPCNTRARKDAGKEWVTMWCAAIARNDYAELEALMGEPEASSTSPGAKRSRSCLTAVAATANITAVAATDGEAPPWAGGGG